MMNYFRNIGKALMMPIAVLPAAAILAGLGNWLVTLGILPVLANIMFVAGTAILDNMAILFAIGLGYGLSKDKNGGAALGALVMWAVLAKLLTPDSLVGILSIPVDVDAGQTAIGQLGSQIGSIEASSFLKVNNAFIGIAVGVISAEIYNRCYKIELPTALSFFSGRRLVAIATAFAGIVLAVVLYFVWPILFTGLVNFGEFIASLGAFGAGLYGFANRLLIPTGLHHALNSVFWFDVAGINDIGNFLGCTPELFNSATGVCASGIEGGVEVVKGTTGMYMSGFFPIMMFGLPGAALAIYHTALPENKVKVGSIMLAGAFASFFTGVTEPLEFSFMFVAWPLYVLHAVLTGVSMFFASLFHWTNGFGFSAGLVDYVLNFTNPLANKPYMLIIEGLVIGLVYYGTFRFAITKFKILTPGRTAGEFEETEEEVAVQTGSIHEQKATKMHKIIGKDNLVEIDNCATRLRLKVKDSAVIDEDKLKKAGALGVMKPDAKSIQIIIGPTVEFVAEALKDIHR